jgi:hypothetical protein
MSNCLKFSNYAIDVDTNVPHHLRDSNPNSALNRNPINGELYSGEHSTKPWMPIRVTPTATNYIHRNLLSANPPPGATEQYVGTNRIGNNYTSMPNIHWYNPNSKNLNNGPYNLKVTK